MVGLPRLIAAASAIVFAASGISGVAAQSPAPAPDTPYSVTYIEVSPKSAGAARKLLLDYRAAARKAAGAVEFDTFARIGYSNQFAIVESWNNAKSREDNASSAASRTFRSALAPLLSAGYDERPHEALSVGVKAAGTIYAITHVDIVPPKKDDGVAATKALAEQSRGTPGNTRFDAWVQANRGNHMTLVEGWQSKAAQEAHVGAAHTKTYRIGLQPMSGALYDERLYRRMR